MGNHVAGTITMQTLSAINFDQILDCAAREEIIQCMGKRMSSMCKRRKAKSAKQIMAPLCNVI